jgi:hypothetical protein
VDSLAPALPISTFRTGTLAGFVAGTTAALTGVPDDAPVATIQMRVWDNKGGTIMDWASALAQPAGSELAGVSAPFNLANIGNHLGNPQLLVGLQSFNLIYNVPEPPALALLGLGAAFACLPLSRKTWKPDGVGPAARAGS